MKPTKELVNDFESYKNYEDELNEKHLKRLKFNKKSGKLAHGLVAGSGATLGAALGAISGKHKIAKGVTGAAIGTGLGHVVGKTLRKKMTS